MRKLMMMCAVAAVAASVQAVSITWSLGAKTLYNYEGSAVGKDATCYLVLDGYVSTIDAMINKNQSFDGITKSATLGIVDVGVTTGATGGMGTAAQGSGVSLAGYKSSPTASSTIAVNDTVSWRVLFIDTANNAWKYSDVLDAKTYDETAATVVKSTAKFTSAKFGSNNGTAWQTLAPEPTSGILLLVGAGLLGLRRRRA